MTPREEAAFNAGIEAARQMAMVAAVTIEAREDAGELRQRAASAALLGFADGAKALLLEPSPCSLADLNSETNHLASEHDNAVMLQQDRA